MAAAGDVSIVDMVLWEKLLWGREKNSSGGEWGLFAINFIFWMAHIAPVNEMNYFQCCRNLAENLAENFSRRNLLNFWYRPCMKFLKSWLAVSHPVCHKIFRQPLNFGTMLAGIPYQNPSTFTSNTSTFLSGMQIIVFVEVFTFMPKSLDIYFLCIFCANFSFTFGIPVLLMIPMSYRYFKLFFVVPAFGTGHAFI